MFWVYFGSRIGSPNEDFQKLKKYPIYYLSISAPNFKMIRPFLTFLVYFKVLGQKGSQGPKNEDFQNIRKIPPDIHLIY